MDGKKVERKTAGDFPPEVLKLFDGYVHGRLDRREFLDRAAKFAVGAFTATAMLESLKPNFAWAQQVPKDDSASARNTSTTIRRTVMAACAATSRCRPMPGANCPPCW